MNNPINDLFIPRYPALNNRINENETFGVEIESIITPDEDDNYRDRSELATFLREVTGVEVYQEGWNTETRSYWKVIYDGSVEGRGEDAEVISPPLKGEEGMHEVNMVVNAMEAFGMEVNSSTGLHVHHDAKELLSSELAMMVQFYSFYEGIIDTFQPLSRRGRNACYCQPVKSFYCEDSAKGVFDIINERLKKVSSGVEKIGDTYNTGIKYENMNTLFRREYGGERYCKLNLNSFYKHGTVEFRHHSGTVDAEKVLNWIELTQHIVNYVRRKKSRITGRHTPSFKKMMELLDVRPEIHEFYDKRRKHFRSRYGKMDAQCTNYKNGYKN